MVKRCAEKGTQKMKQSVMDTIHQSPSTCHRCGRKTNEYVVETGYGVFGLSYRDHIPVPVSDEIEEQRVFKTLDDIKRWAEEDCKLTFAAHPESSDAKEVRGTVDFNEIEFKPWTETAPGVYRTETTTFQTHRFYPDLGPCIGYAEIRTEHRKERRMKKLPLGGMRPKITRLMAKGKQRLMSIFGQYQRN